MCRHEVATAANEDLLSVGLKVGEEIASGTHVFGSTGVDKERVGGDPISKEGFSNVTIPTYPSVNNKCLRSSGPL